MRLIKVDKLKFEYKITPSGIDKYIEKKNQICGIVFSTFSKYFLSVSIIGHCLVFFEVLSINSWLPSSIIHIALEINIGNICGRKYLITFGFPFFTSSKLKSNSCARELIL